MFVILKNVSFNYNICFQPVNVPDFSIFLKAE